MKILITGAFGFVGRTLIEQLEQRGHELVLVDRQQPDEATVFVPFSHERSNVPYKPNWPFYVADMLDIDIMKKALEGVDAIVHLAASPSGDPKAGVYTFHTNVQGTFVLLDLCRLLGVSRFVCASSINAFGTFGWRINNGPIEYDRLPLMENTAAVPQDPYSLSKWVNEETCATFHRAYGIRTAALRFGMVWNTERYTSVMEEGLPETTAWGNDLFSWVHVNDVALGIRQAVEFPELPGHGVYTLSAADTRCPEPTIELVRKFRPDYLERLSAPLFGREPLLSIQRAQQAFGYDPKFRLGK